MFCTLVTDKDIVSSWGPKSSKHTTNLRVRQNSKSINILMLEFQNFQNKEMRITWIRTGVLKCLPVSCKNLSIHIVKLMVPLTWDSL